MTDSFVTQCPHCQTSFRVGHAQLSVARGMVRCGACLQVFNAARQLLEQRALASPAPDIEPPPADVLPPEEVIALAPQPASAQDDDLWHVSELELDNLDLDEELARLERREHAAPTTFGQARPAPASDETALAPLSAVREPTHHDSAEWVASLPNDDVDHLPEVQAEVVSTEPPEGHPEAPAEDDHPPLDEQRTEPSLSSVVVDDDEPRLEPVPVRKSQTADKQERWSALDDEDDEQDEPLRDERGRSEPGMREQALMDLTDDPLQLDWQRPKPVWGRRLLWGSLVALALAGLLGQYVWYHFDQLARQDQYRPWFQELCPQFGCKVPSKVDIAQLRSSNLVVRSHPEFQGALVVDAIIYNRASFSQPFPLLELRFADTSGQLIASRRFKPGEYLSGEMAGKEEMPPQTPIHIALDILDPGAKAVNYSLNFRSPE